MTTLHSDRKNIIWLANPSRRHDPMQRIATACDTFFWSVRRWLAERSKQRQERAQASAAERLRQRRALAKLSERDLKDIGLSRYDVEIELRKPFWR